MTIVPFTFTSRIEAARLGHGEDRIATVALPDRLLAIVADGAGGTSGGAAAAEAICAALSECADSVPASWGDWLAVLDRKIASAPSCGLAAAVVIELRDDGAIVGASVGDCEAFIYGDGEPIDLTSAQHRKPLIGSGDAVPVSFSARASSGGTLVAGSDGLWRYMSRARIREAASTRPLEALATALVEAVKLRNRTLQDDVGVLVCEWSCGRPGERESGG